MVLKNKSIMIMIKNSTIIYLNLYKIMINKISYIIKLKYFYKLQMIMNILRINNYLMQIIKKCYNKILMKNLLKKEWKF